MWSNHTKFNWENNPGYLYTEKGIRNWEFIHFHPSPWRCWNRLSQKEGNIICVQHRLWVEMKMNLPLFDRNGSFKIKTFRY